VVERELKLNPILIWTQLYAFYTEKSWIEVSGAELTYMAFLLCNISGDVVYLRDFFFSSLRLYRYIIIIYCLISDSDPCWAHADYSLYTYREKTLFKKTL